MSLSTSSASPLDRFLAWFDEAVAAGVAEPEAMALATSDAAGSPSVRFVLFRGTSQGGIRFFTNLQSRKGEQLAANPRAAAVFYWGPLGRQVRLEGRVERLDAAEDDAYFEGRPRAHRLAALASPQSRPITHAELLARYAALDKAHAGGPVARPPHWGGYRLVPDRIEFWTRRESRLHERIVHQLRGGTWSSEEVGP